MSQAPNSAMKEIYAALESASVDLYGFSLVLHGGGGQFAEPAVLDTLLLGLENHWFTENDAGSLSHEEFREDFFRSLWERCRGAKGQVMLGTEVPLGHDEMAFYQLPQVARAALYLRVRKRFSYAGVAQTLGTGEGVVREEIERAREFLLGRRLKSVEWAEEDF
ncbi:MAG: hypothetical protein EOP11_08795 [Proteobacteria bacterium]|nr:MAG: hypothetical protein EOP11_08795 [Pseudomonadota bacterium]